MADEKAKMKMKNKKKEKENVPADSDLLKPSNVKTKVKREVEPVIDNPKSYTSPPLKMKEKEKEKEKEKDKKQRKLYDLPGQKRDPPEERDPLRIFYETLYEQRPTSEMAEFWMMEHGLLSPEKATKTFEKKQKKQHQVKLGSPVKSSSVKKIHQNLAESSDKDVSKVSSKSKKKRAHLSDSDSDELIMPKKKLRMSS